MRRRVLVSAVLLVVPVLSAPAVSAAPDPAPTRELCAADATRGAVPATFPIEACVDGTSMTLRNDRDRPVVVTGRGEFGAREMLTVRDDALSDVVRRTSPSALVLLPGEAARWPIGPGAAMLAVAPLPVPAAPEIAQVLDPVLGEARAADATQDVLEAAGALVVDVASAVRARATCVEGQSFLGAAACDVTAAAAIGSATGRSLDPRTVAEILPRLLDPAAWVAWPLADADWPADAEPSLRQQAIPAPAPAPPPPATPASAGTRGPRAPATGQPREPVARPAPTPARTSPPARTAPAPSPAPSPPPQVVQPSWQEIHERNMARLRELAEAWEKARKAWQEKRERDGGGRDRGRGNR